MKQLFASLMIAAACGPVSAQTWNMPTAYSETNFHTRNLKQFAQDVDKETGGKLTITIHSSGSLIKMPEIKRAVQTGQVPIGEIFLGTIANETPLYSFDSIPFMVSGPAQAQKLWTALRPLIEARMEKQNLHVLYSVGWPATGLYMKNPIHSQAELKGMKFRSPSSSMAEFAKRLGAVPTVVQAADIPQAFLTGQVDAMLTSSTTGVESQAWDYLGVFYNVPTMVPQNIVFVNNRVWQGLDPATRSAVTEAARRAEARGWEMSVNEDASNVAKLKANKLEVRDLDPEVLQTFKEVGAKMAVDWMAKLPEQERAAVESVTGK